MKTYSDWWFQTPDNDCNLVWNYKFICSSVTVLWHLNDHFNFHWLLKPLSTWFKFKTGFHVTIYLLSRATVQGEWFLIILHETNQQYKQKQKIMFDKSLYAIRRLLELQDPEAPFELHFWLSSNQNLFKSLQYTI